MDRESIIEMGLVILFAIIILGHGLTKETPQDPKGENQVTVPTKEKQLVTTNYWRSTVRINGTKRTRLNWINKAGEWEYKYINN